MMITKQLRIFQGVKACSDEHPMTSSIRFRNSEFIFITAVSIAFRFSSKSPFSMEGTVSAFAYVSSQTKALTTGFIPAISALSTGHPLLMMLFCVHKLIIYLFYKIILCCLMIQVHYTH